MPETATAPSRPRRGTRHAPAEERRTQILEAAQRCFARSGYERTRMDDVAAECGLSKGSLYRFFDCKDALLLALFDHFEAMLYDSLEPADDRAGRRARRRSNGPAH